MFEKLELIQKRYDELSQLLAQVEIASDPRRLQELGKEKADLEDIVGKYQEYKAKGRELAELEALLRPTPGQVDEAIYPGYLCG